MSIVLSGLSKHYGKTLALDHISLTINPGIHGLLGSNGAGKTTLMRILATILNSDAGEITWGDAVNWKRPGSVKGLLGYLPQQFGMYKHLRVEEALMCVALLKDIPKEQEEAQVKLVMEQMNLEQYARRKVGQLSGGMLRRLGVAQAMLGNPKLLILDEPSVGLDPEERINLRKTIRDYAARDRIVLISSHIVSDVESLCDEVSIMHHGKILVSGNTQEVQTAAANKVREELLSEGALRALEKTNTIIQFAPDNGEYRVRYLTDEPLVQSTVTPTLEDSYTYIIKKDQKA